MKTQKKALLPLLMALTLLTFSTAFAQEGEILPCEGENVSGTVVAVDEATNTATVDTGEGQCTVTLTGEYDHPITNLLGSYFGDVNPDSLAAALETTQGCALFDEESGTYSWVDCATEGAVEATVTGENEDGTFSATTADGETISVGAETDAAAELSGALETLSVEWELTEEGSVVDAGDEIAAYHEEGMGFGVITKIYAIAEESQEACAAAETEAAADEGTDGETPEETTCGVTVEELMAAWNDGMSMGEMFKEYGKPSMLGVGHVRNADKEKPGKSGEAPGKSEDKSNKGCEKGKSPKCETPTPEPTPEPTA
ncbi:MAG: hypothetical protein OEZ02_13685 [Anaerolineae bacterium]|nr:hypothetical protein [Anaerolineae bacterium]